MDDLTQRSLREVAITDDATYSEAMLFDYERDWMPPGLEQLERPDVLAWCRRGRPAAHSRVAYARWDESNVERGIDEVLRFFGEQPFNWHIGPSSSPSDLGERLARRGMELVASPRMMTVTLPLAGDWRPRAAVSVTEVHDETTMRLSLALAHHGDEELEEMLPERLSYLAIPGRRGGFLIAFIGDTAVGNAGYRYSADGACVYLTGAETVQSTAGWACTRHSSRIARTPRGGAAAASHRSSRTQRHLRRSCRDAASSTTGPCRDTCRRTPNRARRADTRR